MTEEKAKILWDTELLSKTWTVQYHRRYHIWVERLYRRLCARTYPRLVWINNFFYTFHWVAHCLTIRDAQIKRWAVLDVKRIEDE